MLKTSTFTSKNSLPSEAIEPRNYEIVQQAGDWYEVETPLGRRWIKPNDYAPLSFTENLVQNSGFEKWSSGLPNYWSLYGNTTLSDLSRSTGKVNGSYSTRLTSTSDANPTEIISDYIKVDAGFPYTISWYDLQKNNGESVVNIQWYDASKSILNEEIVGNLEGEKQTWSKRNANVLAPPKAVYGRIVLSVANAQTYFDNIQMEQVQFSNRGNVVSNGSFETDRDKNEKPDQWTITSGVSTDFNTAKDGTSSVKIVGNGTNDRSILQTFENPGKKGTLFAYAGSSKAEGLTGTPGNYQLVLRLWHEDGTNTRFNLSYTKSTHDWQFKSDTVIAPKDYTKYEIYAQFNKQTGTVWFDDFTLKVMNPNDAQSIPYNIAGNPSFEQVDASGNIIDWIPWVNNTGTVSRVSKTENEPIYTGEYAYRISNSTTGKNIMYHNHYEPIKAGKTYTFSVMTKAVGVTKGGGNVVIQVRDKNNTLLKEVLGTQTLSGTTDWQRISVTVSEEEAKAINANAFQLRGFFYTLAGTTGEVYFDAVQFEEKN